MHGSLSPYTLASRAAGPPGCNAAARSDESASGPRTPSRSPIRERNLSADRSDKTCCRSFLWICQPWMRRFIRQRLSCAPANPPSSPAACDPLSGSGSRNGFAGSCHHPDQMTGRFAVLRRHQLRSLPLESVELFSAAVHPGTPLVLVNRMFPSGAGGSPPILAL
jgi:hypothetical protein